MKRMLLTALVAQSITTGAMAATPAAEAAPVTAPASAAAPSRATAPAVASSAQAEASQAKIEEARKQLDELRDQMRELSRKMATLSSEIGEGGPRSYAMRYLGDPDRALIGVVLGMDEGHVTVGALTPDGPAARAGLRGSDVVTAIDHHSIEAKDVVASAAKAKALLANLKEGQHVTIEYQRDGKPGVVTLTAERREAWNWPMFMNQDPEHPFLPKDFNERVRADVERATREAERTYERDHQRVQEQVERATREAMKHVPNEHSLMRLAMPWWGLNLAPLNADLGRYFGTDKGVLVIAADNDSLPGIRAGDVITRIAGEDVDRPEDALRALRDQKSGADVPIKIMRDRKTLALNMKTPAFKSIFDMRVPAPLEPPAPAAPPAPPAPSVAPAGHVPAPPAVAATPPSEPPAVPGDDD